MVAGVQEGIELGQYFAVAPVDDTETRKLA